MILYHTSDRVIQHPDIRCGRKNADFGQGFYLTPDREFTHRWAGRDQEEQNAYMEAFARAMERISEPEDGDR